jgi:hypothetical protein
MSQRKDGTRMSFRLPTYLREEISRTADTLEMTDSYFVRVAITSALAKYAQRVSARLDA